MGRKTQQQMLNMQAQLEHIGIRLETLSRLKFNYDRGIDTIGTEFNSVLRDLDAQQNCNKYVWKGLPDNLYSWLIEEMLYYRGSLCGFIKGGILYILPYAQAKGVNVYGLPNAVSPITYNGAMTGNDPFNYVEQDLPVNNFGDINSNARACILYDRIPVFSTNSSPMSRALLNEELIKYQCEILGRIKNNLKNLDKKVLFTVENETQANQMKNDLRQAYGTDDPFIVVVKGTTIDSDNKGQTLQGDIANETQSLFETWQSVNSIRCMCSGITNGGAFEKKERKITGELQGDQTQTDLVIDAGLQMRKLFLDQMKRIYPEYSEILSGITVELNESTKEEDYIISNENGSNQAENGQISGGVDNE